VIGWELPCHSFSINIKNYVTLFGNSVQAA
jgi:hypothetical protein